MALVAALEHCGVREAAEKLVVRWSVPSGQAFVQPREATVTKKIEALQPLPFRLRGVNSRHAYVSARGISERTAESFDIGFYDGPGLLSRRLVRPIHGQ